MGASTATIHVVAGLIHRNGKLLVCQRSARGAHPLKWEFPGGKVEPGESDRCALRREIREELNLDIEGFELVHQEKHRYPGGPAISLRFYRIAECTGEMQNRVFERIEWVRPGQLVDLDFLEGDRVIVRKLASEPEAWLRGDESCN